MNDVLKAAQLFRNGHACSQAILEVYGTPLGLPREMAMRIAAGFAGGMRLGETYGAVTLVVDHRILSRDHDHRRR